MINTGTILKGIFVTFGSFAFSYSLLQSPYAPPLQDPQWLNPESANLFMGHEGVAALATLPAPAAGSSHWEDKASSLSLTNDQILTPKEQALYVQMNARRGEPMMTPEEFLQAIQTPNALTPVEGTPPRLPIPIGVQHQVEVVHIYRDKLETLFPGDELSIDSDYLGNSLVIVIDQVVDHFDGSITWHGYLKGLDQSYRASFTQGALFTLADLATPQGRYQLEAHGEYGWLMPTRSPTYRLEISGYAARSRLP